MKLPVVVSSYNSTVVLRRCLEALLGQEEAGDIVVMDCSDEDPTLALKREFPSVEFVHLDGPRSPPALRWEGVRRLEGELVGAIETRCVPAPDWCARMIAAHREQPRSGVIGGPIARPEATTGFDRALYLCEYSAFAPPLPEGPAAGVCDANLSYKRSRLERDRELLDAGVWQTVLDKRDCDAGTPPALASATVEFHNTMGPATALRQRFHYGRGYAAERIAYQAAGRRLLYAPACVVLPTLLSWRQIRVGRSKGVADLGPLGRFWLLALNTAWSAGEAVGYLLGPPRRKRIY